MCARVSMNAWSLCAGWPQQRGASRRATARDDRETQPAPLASELRAYWPHRRRIVRHRGIAMNLRTLVVSAIVLAAPAVASAQPGYYRGAPPPGGAGYYASSTTAGGFWDRGGRLTLGISLGLGGV